MALFEVTPHDRQVYERELRDFLPRRMIDIHTHVWLESLVREKGEFRAVTWPTLVAADNSIEDLQETYRLMFPDKEVSAMFFGSSKKNSMDAINDYVARCSRKSGFPCARAQASCTAISTAAFAEVFFASTRSIRSHTSPG